MSLSPEPTSVRYDASSRASERIWAAAVYFSRTAGSSTSAFYISVIWAGMLYDSRNELIHNNLFDSVRKDYVQAVSRLYRLSLDDFETLSGLNLYANSILESLQEIRPDLHTDEGVRSFLAMANAIQAEDGEQVAEPTDQQIASFRSALTVLYSGLRSAIYNTEPSPYLLQHPDPFAPAVPPAPPVRQTATPRPAPQSKPKRGFLSFLKAFAKITAITLLILVILKGIAFVAFNLVSDPGEQPSMTQVTKPRTGEILFGEEYDGSEITITAGKEHDYVVTLQDKDGIHYIVFYVRAGTTVTKGVPDAKLYVHFASGTNWYGYGKGRMFGPDTYYSKDDEALDFSQSAWEYTLYPVTDGNFTETPSSEDEFF